MANIVIIVLVVEEITGILQEINSHVISQTTKLNGERQKEQATGEPGLTKIVRINTENERENGTRIETEFENKKGIEHANEIEGEKDILGIRVVAIEVEDREITEVVVERDRIETRVGTVIVTRIDTEAGEVPHMTIPQR